MKVRTVKRFMAICGRGFWDKNKCLIHEQNCKCWTNPKYKTCKTCKHGRNSRDEGWQCDNPRFVYDIHFTPAHKNAEDLCINCPVWEAHSNHSEEK
jgi:hypothetical protein